MPFEVFVARLVPSSKSPSVTIQKRGIFSFNRAAHKLIDEAETVELLFDPENQIIALRPSDEAHAYTLRHQGTSETGQMILSATRFTQHYDIDTTVSRRWKPYGQDGMLCIDLRSDSVEISGNRSKRADQEDGSGET